MSPNVLTMPGLTSGFLETNQRRSDIQRGLGAKCFIKFQEWRGLRPSRRDSSGQDGKLYTGGKAGQIYPIGCDGKTSDVIANTRWKRPLSCFHCRHRFSFFAPVADAKSCVCWVCRMRHIVSEKIFACALCGTWQASSIAW